MTDFEIRFALEQDIEEIEHVRRLTWPEDDGSLQRIARVLALENHAVMLACRNGQIAGFVDGFMTFSSRGVPRWEVDLLAVHPAFRGQGAGKALVQQNTEEGRKRNAALARGLIKVDNFSSQKVFEAYGYQAERQNCCLHILTQPENQETVFMTAHPALIPVETINYRGIWVEEDLSRKSFEVARNMLVLHTEWNLAGSVLPESNVSGAENAQQIGFKPVGLYRWWKVLFN